MRSWARENEIASTILGMHLVGIGGPAGIAGVGMLHATETGRYTLAATIVVGTAVASWYCGGCGAVLTAP